MNPVIRYEFERPSVAPLKMLSEGRGRYRVLGIDQKNRNAGRTVLYLLPESLERAPAVAAAHDLPTPGTGARRLPLLAQKRIHAAPEPVLGGEAPTAALHENRNGGHGFAPSAPMRQMSPKAYSSSQ